MRLGFWILVLGAGCSAADSSYLGDSGYMPEDLPPWSCDTDATGTTTGCEASSGSGGASSCAGSGECDQGVCAAPFDGDIGVFRCVDSCVQTEDDSAWCADASACCDPAASCERGLCIVDAGASTGDTGGSSGGSGSSGAGSSSGADSTTTMGVGDVG
ncbi:MAG: hypothetical protein K1X88_18085 [Nannocystaceae bacterium]|nr:hypothetical protein [Nannocystaceae bacterium]